jgi:hypothetical protein
MERADWKELCHVNADALLLRFGMLDISYRKTIQLLFVIIVSVYLQISLVTLTKYFVNFYLC